MNTIPRDVPFCNVFARELQNALCHYDACLEDLPKLRFESPWNMQIHRMTVKRLRQSLDGKLRSFPTLNPEQLQAVIKYYAMTLEEIAALKASLLACSVGHKLLDRIPQDTMYVVQQIFALFAPVVLSELRTNHEQSWAHILEKGGTVVDEAELERAFAVVALQYDQALLALHMAGESQQTADRASSAFQAHKLIEDALAHLKSMPESLQQSEYGEYYAECLRNDNARANAITQECE